MSRIIWDKKKIDKYCEDNSCEFLSSVYETNKLKYLFKCSCGDAFSKRFDQFLKVPRCKNCGHRRGRGIKEHIEVLKDINSKRIDYGVIYQRGGVGGKGIKVDLSMLEFLLGKALWSINAHGYASRHSYETGFKELMHRVVLGVSDPNNQVDHINGDKLDNREGNLRIVTTSQNLANSRSEGNYASSYKGVTITPQGKFRARLGYRNDRIFIGDFDTETEAAEAYNAKSLELFGEYAYLNKV